jgi:hypothetical protein
MGNIFLKPSIDNDECHEQTHHPDSNDQDDPNDQQVPYTYIYKDGDTEVVINIDHIMELRDPLFTFVRNGMKTYVILEKHTHIACINDHIKLYEKITHQEIIVKIKKIHMTDNYNDMYKFDKQQYYTMGIYALEVDKTIWRKNPGFIAEIEVIMDKNNTTFLPNKTINYMAYSRNMRQIPSLYKTNNNYHYINLSDNKLSFFDIKPQQLQYLVKLNLSKNNLTSVPPTHHLYALKFLDVSHNRITESPYNMGTNLVSLNLKNNFISSYKIDGPPNPSLKYLNLRKNLLDTLPDLSTIYPNLEHLYIDPNVYISNKICMNTHLKELLLVGHKSPSHVSEYDNKFDISILNKNSDVNIFHMTKLEHIKLPLAHIDDNITSYIISFPYLKKLTFYDSHITYNSGITIDIKKQTLCYNRIHISDLQPSDKLEEILNKFGELRNCIKNIYLYKNWYMNDVIMDKVKILLIQYFPNAMIHIT